MNTLSTRQEIIIDAPPVFCFERFSDLGAYPQWEPSARSVRVMEQDECRRLMRVEFCYEKRLLFYSYQLTYSLRCQIYEKNASYWIKFDDPRGDLRSLMTIVEFAPFDGRCRMSYRGVVDEQVLLRRALVAFFGPKELRSHLERFRDHVEDVLPRYAVQQAR